MEITTAILLGYMVLAPSSRARRPTRSDTAPDNGIRTTESSVTPSPIKIKNCSKLATVRSRPIHSKRVHCCIAIAGLKAPKNPRCRTGTLSAMHAASPVTSPWRRSLGRSAAAGRAPGRPAILPAAEIVVWGRAPDRAAALCEQMGARACSQRGGSRRRCWRHLHGDRFRGAVAGPRDRCARLRRRCHQRQFARYP
jgi:hypothetical protein